MKIMRLKRSHVEARAEERGYDVERVRPCLLKDLGGGWWDVDVEHERYPHPRAPFRSPAPGFGPGTELKRLLSSLGIQAKPNCSCNAKAQLMDVMEAQEPGWCEANIPTILGWLEEQAKSRKLPFVRFAAEQAVKLAIRRARKKATKRKPEGT